MSLYYKTTALGEAKILQLLFFLLFYLERQDAFCTFPLHSNIKDNARSDNGRLLGTPLFLRPEPDHKDFAYPFSETADYLSVRKGKSIRIACPGSTSMLNPNGEIPTNIVTGTCGTSNNFKFEYSGLTDAPLEEIKCKKHPRAELVIAPQGCAGRNTMKRIGYMPTNE